MSRKNKVKIFKIVMMIIALLLIVGVATYLVPVMANLSTVEGQLEFKEKVSSSRHIRTSYIIWTSICTNISNYITWRANRNTSRDVLWRTRRTNICNSFSIYNISYNIFYGKKARQKICL